jgi:hypothetical protein
MAEIPNATEPMPSIIATDVVSALTVAEWELGIPPLETKSRRSICLFLIKPISTFMNCASAQAQTEAMITLFIRVAYLGAGEIIGIIPDVLK